MTLETLQLGMEWFSEYPGGLNRVYANLLQQLATLGVRSEGLVSGSPEVSRLSGGLARSFARADVPVLQRLRALRRAAMPWLTSHGRDSVIVSHFALHALPILDFLGQRPFVVHFQGPWGEESRVEGASARSVWMKETIERRVYRRADAAITLSEAFRDILVERFGVEAARVHVIPGGVDVSHFDVPVPRALARRQLGWPDNRPTIVCVRRLVHRVGLELLIDAAAEIRATVPDLLVQVIGTGPLREELAARINALGLGDTVRLLGFLPEAQLPLAYRAADVSVVPTIALEGFGLVVVESLAAGTPAIVTPVDGLSEIVTPFAPQLVTQRPDAAALAHTIGGALRRELNVPDAAACVAYARSRFDWPVVAAQVKQVYEMAAS